MSENAGAIDVAFSDALNRIQTPGWSAGVNLSRGLVSWADESSFIGTDYDELSNCAPASQWGENQRALQDLLRTIVPTRKLAVLAMARDEALHLPEWIAHYLAIGAEHLFIYTNDNRDGTDLLLRWFCKNAPVTPIFTTSAPGIDVQRKNYQHAFFLLPELRLFDWVLVVDLDEMLVPAPRYQYRLSTLLDEAPVDAAAVAFPWMWRLWDRSIHRTRGLLSERFPHALAHALCKSAVRLRHATSLCEIHIPTLDKDVDLVDSSFTPISADEIWSGSRKSADGGWIDHYWGRSFEEFVIKKGRGDSLAISSGQFQRAYETFFSWTASLTDDNYLPISNAFIDAVKTRLAIFDRDPEFTALMADVNTFYAQHASLLQKDLGLMAQYQKLIRDIQPSFVAAPSLLEGR